VKKREVRLPGAARWQPWRVLGIGLGYLVLLIAGVLAADWLVGLLDMELRPVTEPVMHRIVVACLIAYVLLMALPFVPGVEIGLALIVLLGADIVPVVYGATVTALTASYTVGRLVPDSVLASAFRAMGMSRAAGLIESLAPLGVDERVARLLAWAHPGIATRLLRHRHIAIAVTLNIPGNNLIGGGGGIALAAGLSRTVSWPAFVLTVALGTSPVPLAVLLFDTVG
jgi:hypothetical protein